MQWSHLFWNFKRNVFIVNYKHSSSSFVVLGAHILSIVFVDYSEERSSSSQWPQWRLKFCCSNGWPGVPCFVWLCLCFAWLGFVVGQSGLYQGIAMFLVAYFIICMTVLSVCAISTNGALDAGGAYCILFTCALSHDICMWQWVSAALSIVQCIVSGIGKYLVIQYASRCRVTIHIFFVIL